MRKLLFAFTFLFAQLAYSQTITGVVKEKGSGLPLPFANVFVNNSTLGAATDAEGNFVIRGQIPEEFELVASFVGYKTVSQTIVRKGRQAVFQHFELELLEGNLSEVELKSRRDKNWERNYKRFREVFLAVPDDPYGRDITIENPWVLDFENVKSEKGFNYTKASADLPLSVVNQALGYEIDYYLQDFRMLRNASRFYGQAFYRELQANDSLNQKEWKDNRELNYRNSIRHLALSLLLRNSGVQGFDLYHNQPESALRNRTNDLTEEMNKSIVPLSINALYNKPLGNGIYRIFLPGRIEIHHRTKPWPNDYYTNYYHAISWMDAPSGYFDVDRNGTLINPTQLVLSGYIGRQRLARSLPLDFVPNENFSGLAEELEVFQSRYIELNALREKAWLTTNKPYFYPGETLWLGGRMLYQNPIKADSLSRVLYVDLVNSKFEKVREETFPIEGGRVSGGMVLDGDIPPGDYLLRAYTRWNMNFPDRDIFQLPIPVLEVGTFPVQRERETDTYFGEVDVRHEARWADSLSYRVVELELSFWDAYQNPLDAEFVLTAVEGKLPLELSDSFGLEKELAWVDYSLPETFDSEMSHPIEYGISVEGRFVPDRKRASAANRITLVKGDMEDYGTVFSDSSGLFWATGLQYRDTAQIAVAALDEKLRPFGSVELLRFQRPGFRGSFPKLDYQISHFSAEDELAMDVADDYVLLEEFVKEDLTVAESIADQNYGYGEPNQEVGPNELEKMTMAEILGLLRFNINTLKFRNYTYGEETGSPQLIIDGVARPYLEKDEFREILLGFEPSQLKSIKVYNDNISNVVFGMAGFAGVMMIETKNGSRTGAAEARKFNSEGFQIFPIRGFTPFPDFPNNPPADEFLRKKSTLYWDPLARTEEGVFKAWIKVPFGVNQVRLRIEGLSIDGEAIYKVIRIESGTGN